MKLGYLAVLAISCGVAQRPFPMRAPMLVDTDTRPVSVACRPEPSPKEPGRMRCAPTEYISPFAWDYIDSTWFARISRALSVEVSGEAANATSLDEVADSSWFDNRIGARPLSSQQQTLGACKPEDILADEVADGAWTVDHGKDNGATRGFRVDVPGKGRYILKADDRGVAERASAASVIGAMFYNAVGFSTTCEQVVFVRRAQLALAPNLTVTSNRGTRVPFDATLLDDILKSSTQVGGRTRMQASKWLDGLPLGPFRYVGMRGDDPNDVIAHENRRELRGSRLLAAWLNHWDAREQNSMDLWHASDPKRPRSSPGYVRHYILDTSDVIGGGSVGLPHVGSRQGHTYFFSPGEVLVDFVTLGAIERPWDRAKHVAGREKFGMFSARDFDPERWQPWSSNPAMVRMTERDGAWMARIIARFTPADIRAIAGAGKFSDPQDTAYLAQVLIDRQHRILARYLTRLSPLADVRRDGDRLCALDLARASGVLPARDFRYTVIQRVGETRHELAVTVEPAGVVCFRPQPGQAGDAPVLFTVRNGTPAGPLEIHAFDQGVRGMFVVGLKRLAR